MAGAAITSACGGGAALMHSAHSLPQGAVIAGAGVGAQFILNERATSVAAGPEPQYLERTVASLSLSPGVSPWVGARAGLGAQMEAGLTYTGRAVRANGRRAFVLGGGDVAISVEAGASAVFSRPGARAPSSADAGRLDGNAGDASAAGYGFDVPILIGWRSTASIVEVWAGLRGGVEHVSGRAALEATSETADLGATRWYGGALVGASVGIQPVWVVLELDTAYQALSLSAEFPASAGPPGRRSASLTGGSLSPTGALVVRF